MSGISRKGRIEEQDLAAEIETAEAPRPDLASGVMIISSQ